MLLHIWLGVGVLGQTAVLVSGFRGTSVSSSVASAPSYSPTSSAAKAPVSPHPRQYFFFFSFFLFQKNCSCPHGCEMISHCGFDLCFSNNRAPFHMSLGYSYIVYGEMSISCSLPILDIGLVVLFCFLLLSCRSFLYIKFLSNI